MRSTSHALVTVALGLAVGVSACGGGGGGGSANDQADITKVLSTGMTSKDATVVCDGTLSAAMIKRLYGSAANCHKVEAKNAADGNQARSVKVSNVQVDGKQATAFVVLAGGDQDGARGAISLQNEAGSGWRVSDLSVAFLRSEFEAGMRNSNDLAAELKQCLGRKVLALDDAAFTKLAYGSIGETSASQRQLTSYLGDCAGSSSGGSSKTTTAGKVLRDKFEEGIAESLKKGGAGAKAIGCVKRELRTRLSDDQIATIVSAGGKDASGKVTAGVAAAMAACGATG